MPDPIIIAASEILDLALADMSAAIDGAPAEALNWRPGGAETNSIAVLATHALASTRSWFACATGSERPQRDRPSEFKATAAHVAELRTYVDTMGAECRAMLERADVRDWSVLRPTHARPGGDMPAEVTAAWALMHALEHLREHVGHVGLTRQLWDSRP
jgi:uncharacterized damage-inducible protein DinB